MKSSITVNMGGTDMRLVEMTVEELPRVLDAMLWVFNPYLDDQSSLLDHPHIVELAEVYNYLLGLIPYGYSYDYEPIEIF